MPGLDVFAAISLTDMKKVFIAKTVSGLNIGQAHKDFVLLRYLMSRFNNKIAFLDKAYMFVYRKVYGVPSPFLP